MANPQIENGYTRIANEILEQLVKMNLLGAEFRVIYFLLRKTYGYGKKSDIISLTQFEKGTGLSRPTVVKTLKNLMIKNMIVKVALPEEGIEYTFEKNHEKWVVNTALLVKHNDTGSKARLTSISKDGLTDTSKDGLTHKRKKESIKERTKEKAEQSSADIILLLDVFRKINPAVKRMYGNITQRKACRELIDTYGLERLTKIVLETLPKTNGLQFFPTITTPLQLQDKYIQLESAIRKYQSEKLQAKEKYKVI